MSGFFTLERGWSDSPCFTDAHDRYAWVWLIEHACFADTTIGINGKPVPLKRGQCAYSIRFLAEAWCVSFKRARIILDLFKNWKMIVTEKGTQRLIITICNYDKYQDKRENQGTTRAPSGHEQGHAQGTNNKEYNNNNIDNNTPYSPPKGEVVNEFEELWTNWKPFDMVKGSKAVALKSYVKARKGVNHETISRGAAEYLASCHQRRTKTKHVATWLNQAGWADDYAQPAEPSERSRPAWHGATSYERGIMASLAGAKRRGEADDTEP